MASTSGASSSAQKPFFRYDLQTTAVEEGGQRYVDVSCPDTGSSFRFFEVEYAVACGMDGERDLSGLVAWAQAELDLRTNAQEVGAILDKLSELNFVEGVAPPAELQEPLALEPAPVVASIAAPMAAPLAAAPAHDAVELGLSGRSPMSRERPAAPAMADDLELGLAGASTLQGARPGTPADASLELGAAGYEYEEAYDAPQDFPTPSQEVSTDLSQTFRIDKNDVQAAVRASRIMSAVDVPADLKSEIDRMDAAEAVGLSPAENADDLEFQIGEEARTSTGREAIVLPEEPAQIAKREAAEALADKAAEAAERAEKKKSPERRSASIVLWLLLLAAVGAGAAYYYVEYVKEEPGDVGASGAAKRAAQRPIVPPVIEPEAPVGKLVVGEAPLAEAKAGQAGIVEFVAEPGSEVAAGDVILKLTGYERFDREIAKHESSLAQYQTRLESARARNEAIKVASLEKDVARKQNDVAAATAKRDAFFVKAETGGVVEALVEARARVEPDQTVAKVTGPAIVTVQFQLPAGVSAALGDERTVVDVADPELTATCKVVEAEGQAITLSCPADSGLAADSDVKLAL